MKVSIRYKSALPVSLLAMISAVFVGFVLVSQNHIASVNAELVERFDEIDRVHHIQTSLSQLLLPLTLWSDSKKVAHLNQLKNDLNGIEIEINNLTAMDALTPKESDTLQLLLNDLEKIDIALTALPHSPTPLPGLDSLHEVIASAMSRLENWHVEETQQVKQLQIRAELVFSEIRYWANILVVFIALVTAVSLWLNKHILIKPILKIRDSLEQLSQGNLSAKLPVQSEDEIGDLAQSFNEMSESINRLYCQMEDMAQTDPLTGLFNRMAFDKISQRQLNQASRNQSKFALAILDLDHFKKINDTFGHPVGDAVLSHVAKICSDTLRRSDYIFRFGGEEFVLILSDSLEEDALSAVERFREAIRHHPYRDVERQYAITVSIGIAIYPDDGTQIETLITNADLALYRAKAAGRDCSIAFHNLQKVS